MVTSAASCSVDQSHQASGEMDNRCGRRFGVSELLRGWVSKHLLKRHWHRPPCWSGPLIDPPHAGDQAGFVSWSSRRNTDRHDQCEGPRTSHHCFTEFTPTGHPSPAHGKRAERQAKEFRRLQTPPRSNDGLNAGFMHPALLSLKARFLGCHP